MGKTPLLVVVVVVFVLLLGGATPVRSATPSLSDLIRTTPDGSTLTLSGEYVVDETIEIFDRRNLTIQGDGTAVVRQSNNGDDGAKVFVVTGGTNVTFQNFEIAGANPDAGSYSRRSALGAAIAIKGTQGVRIEGMHIHDTWGDFVDLDTGGRDFPTTEQVSIVGNTLERSGRQGVSISRMVVDVRIEGNQVREVARSVFDIEHARVVSGIDIADNVVHGYRHYFLFIGRGGDVSDVAVTGNTATGPGPGETGGKGFVHVLLRDPLNLVQGVLVCDNVVENYLDQNDFSGATDVVTTCATAERVYLSGPPRNYTRVS